MWDCGFGRFWIARGSEARVKMINLNGFDFNFIILDRIYRIIRIIFEGSPDESAQTSSPSTMGFIPNSLHMVRDIRLGVAGIFPPSGGLGRANFIRKFTLNKKYSVNPVNPV